MAEVAHGISAGETASIIVLRDEIPSPRSHIKSGGLWTAACNVGLAVFFFSGILRGAFAPTHSLADIIWMVGAALMGLFALVRVAPKAELVTFATLSATGGMMLIPMLLRAAPGPHGLLYREGEAVQLAGILISQISRIYLGRSFGLLPANRGIVTRGPFGLVRHPVYLGWLVLTIGFTMTNPSNHNMLVAIAILPFMFARIEQEETLLQADPDYRAYSALTPYRLLPGLF